MVEFGTDYSMYADLDEQGDIKTVEYTDNLRQRIRNILLVPYDYYGDEFGSNLWKILGNDLSDNNLKLTELYIKSSLKKDERIKDVKISNVYKNINRDIIVNLNVSTYDDEEIEERLEISNNELITFGDDDL